MGNTIAKVRPEVKDDEQFQKGLKIITNIQIWLFVLLAIFNILLVFVVKVPIDFMLLRQIVLRFMFISILGCGFRKVLIGVITLNVISVMGIIILFVLSLGRLNILGILISVLEIIFVLGYIMCGVIMFNLKETKYVLEKSTQIFQEVREENRNKKRGK